MVDSVKDMPDLRDERQKHEWRSLESELLIWGILLSLSDSIGGKSRRDILLLSSGFQRTTWADLCAYLGVDDVEFLMSGEASIVLGRLS